MDHTIITGHYVRIGQIPASLGERLLALALDYVFMGGIVSCIAYLADTSFGGRVPDMLWFIMLFFLLLYSLLFEVFNNGQTPGKRILHLRVTRVDGHTPTLGDYFLRWLIYPIDLIFAGAVGLLCVMVTRRHQRLGDLAGGTMVVKEPHYRHIRVSLDEFGYLSPDYRPVFPQAADLSLEQANLIERTLHTPTRDRERRIALLARKAAFTLNLPPHIIPDEHLLTTLLRDYRYYALEDI